MGEGGHAVCGMLFSKTGRKKSALQGNRENKKKFASRATIKGKLPDMKVSGHRIKRCPIYTKRKKSLVFFCCFRPSLNYLTFPLYIFRVHTHTHTQVLVYPDDDDGLGSMVAGRHRRRKYQQQVSFNFHFVIRWLFLEFSCKSHPHPISLKSFLKDFFSCTVVVGGGGRVEL